MLVTRMGMEAMGRRDRAESGICDLVPWRAAGVCVCRVRRRTLACTSTRC